MPLDKGQSGRIKNLFALTSGLTKEHIFSAVEDFERLGGNIHSYADSVEYDLYVGDKTYPPKAIFGLAISSFFGEQITSDQFNAGDGQPCFNRLKELGFKIEPKDKERPTKLMLYGLYERADMSRILDPEYVFTAGSGRWGASGIISDSPSQGDAVIITTASSGEGGSYVNYLTEDGYLKWQSQRNNTPESRLVRFLTNIDSKVNDVHLFLRGSANGPYVYLGIMELYDWDMYSTMPVEFIWRLRGGPISTTKADELGITLERPLIGSISTPVDNDDETELVEKDPPPARRKTKSTGKKNGAGHTDYSGREESNQKLGLAGEKLVLAHEIKKLIKMGRPDLAEQVVHTATINSHAGYDVQSFDEYGEEVFIEVKTTRQSKSTPFYISPNEVRTSKEHSDKYVLIRIYNFRPGKEKQDFYKIEGAIEDYFDLEPDSFRAYVK